MKLKTISCINELENSSRNEPEPVVRWQKAEGRFSSTLGDLPKPKLVPRGRGSHELINYTVRETSEKASQSHVSIAVAGNHLLMMILA